jgi:hypothetical protein
LSVRRLIHLAALAAAGCGQSDLDDTAAACTPGSGEPVDLVPWLRIRASGVRPAEGHDWAREVEAGPATVRDDIADNGWQPPAGEIAVLELDLQPWLGRLVSLEAIEARWEGEEPQVSVALLPGCGLEPSEELAWDDPAQALDLGGRCAGCVELRVLGGEDTVLAALSLTSRDVAIEIPALDAITELPQLGSHPGSGLIEGFYGQPWSWRERQATIVTIARAGMDLYLYAPKDDPYHRAQWREPYPATWQQGFDELGILAAALGVDFVLGISPFIDLEPDDEHDYATLRDKLLGFADLGVGGVALLADDIELETEVTVDGALGAQHAAIANRLLAELQAVHPDLGLWFVPTVYSDDRLDRWEGSAAYLEALQALDPSIPVMWTGTGTFAETMQAADMDVVRGLIGRDPLIWDNYWANDAWDLLSGRVHLAPYQGREAALADAVLGIGANPMIQGSLSRLNAGALAAWLRDPATDTSVTGRAAAASLEAQLGYGHRDDLEGDTALLERIMEAFDGSGLVLPAHAELVGWVEAPEDDPAVAAGQLLPILAGLVAAESELHHSGLDSELVDELLYPTIKLRHEGLAGLYALRALGERMSGSDGEAALALARAEIDRSAASRFVFSIGAVQALVDAVAASPVQDLGLEWPVPLPAPIHGCTVGRPWRWQPFGGAQHLEVRGLPGAELHDDEIRWTPPHAGTWQVVVTARRGGGGWAWQALELRCWPG